MAKIGKREPDTMIEVPPTPESYVVPVTWKDRLAPSWPAAMGLAMVVIGASNALSGMVELGRMLHLGWYSFLVGESCYWVLDHLPDVMLLAAGLHVLTRQDNARIFCLIYAWGTIALLAATLALISLIHGPGMLWPSWENGAWCIMATVGLLLLPLLVLLWMAWAPIRREMQCWSRRGQYNSDKPAKFIGWRIVLGWVLIALGLAWLLMSLHPLTSGFLHLESMTLTACSPDTHVLRHVLAPSGLMVSGCLLLARNRAVATVLPIVAIGMLLILALEAIKDLADIPFIFSESDWYSIALLVTPAAPTIFLLWWFLRPSVRRDMSKWGDDDAQATPEEK